MLFLPFFQDKKSCSFLNSFSFLIDVFNSLFLSGSGSHRHRTSWCLPPVLNNWNLLGSAKAGQVLLAVLISAVSLIGSTRIEATSLSFIEGLDHLFSSLRQTFTPILSTLFGSVFKGPFNNDGHHQSAFIAEGKFIHVLASGNGKTFGFCITIYYGRRGLLFQMQWYPFLPGHDRTSSKNPSMIHRHRWQKQFSCLPGCGSGDIIKCV